MAPNIVGAEDDAEPVQDGWQPEAAPVPNHGWMWENFVDKMTEDWRRTAPKLEANMMVGGMNAKDMSPCAFFDAFFPWDYVCNEDIPGTNDVLKNAKQ